MSVEDKEPASEIKGTKPRVVSPVSVQQDLEPRTKNEAEVLKLFRTTMETIVADAKKEFGTGASATKVAKEIHNGILSCSEATAAGLWVPDKNLAYESQPGNASNTSMDRGSPVKTESDPPVYEDHAMTNEGRRLRFRLTQALYFDRVAQQRNRPSGLSPQRRQTKKGSTKG
jgi:hypothetical protein